MPGPASSLTEIKAMSGSDQVYLFQSGDTNRYALSVDPTGCNIPRREHSPPWLLRGDFSECVELPEFDEPVREVARRGYCFLTVTSESEAA
jgi:hypothetical protein